MAAQTLRTFKEPGLASSQTAATREARKRSDKRVIAERVSSVANRLSRCRVPHLHRGGVAPMGSCEPAVRGALVDVHIL